MFEFSLRILIIVLFDLGFIRSNTFGSLSQICRFGNTVMDTEIVKPNEMEVAVLQKRVTELESQLEEAKKLIQKHLLEANEVDMLKMKSADTLTKAKSVIFENTKMIKNQELQIDALNQQVESLRDVVKITKELLEIRNLEVDQLESKIHCMEEKHKAEKERQDLMHKRLEQMIRHNGDLKREYETQLCLFKALRERYSERELAKGVVDSLKSDIKDEKDKKTVQNEVNSQENKEETTQEMKENSNLIENTTEVQTEAPKIENNNPEVEKKEQSEKTDLNEKITAEDCTPVSSSEKPSINEVNSSIEQKEQPKNLPEEPKNIVPGEIQSNVVKQ